MVGDRRPQSGDFSRVIVDTRLAIEQSRLLRAQAAEMRRQVRELAEQVRGTVASSTLRRAELTRARAGCWFTSGRLFRPLSDTAVCYCPHVKAFVPAC